MGMMFLEFAGTVALVFGLLLLLSPDTLRKLQASLDKGVVLFENRLYNLRIGFGVSLLLVSALCYFIAYYLFKRLY